MLALPGMQIRHLDESAQSKGESRRMNYELRIMN